MEADLFFFLIKTIPTDEFRTRGNLTVASPGGEVVVEALGTPALIHARYVDTSGWFFTDAGV